MSPNNEGGLIHSNCVTSLLTPLLDYHGKGFIEAKVFHLVYATANPTNSFKICGSPED